MSRQIGFSGVYLSDTHTAHHSRSDFRDTSAQDPSSDRADTEYAIRRADATTDATARKMRRMRISSILCRCAVSISQIEFLRKRWGNLRKGVTIIDPVKRGLKKSRTYHHSNPNGDNSPACSRAIYRPYRESTLPNRSGDYRRLDLRPSPTDPHNLTGYMRIVKGICESNDSSPADRDEHKPRWRSSLFS